MSYTRWESTKRKQPTSRIKTDRFQNRQETSRMNTSTTIATLLNTCRRKLIRLSHSHKWWYMMSMAKSAHNRIQSKDITKSSGRPMEILGRSPELIRAGASITALSTAVIRSTTIQDLRKRASVCKILKTSRWEMISTKMRTSSKQTKTPWYCQ